MKYYISYMDRQAVSPGLHQRLEGLTAAKPPRPALWKRLGALAACAAVLAGVGLLRPGAPTVQRSAGQFAAGYTPLFGEKDTVAPGDSFVVAGPEDGGKLEFPMVPAIDYRQLSTEAATATDAARIYDPGAFYVSLAKGDIQTIFWGPEGKPPAEHPKLEQGDLPWMLFWEGYTLQGSARYSGQGRLTEVVITGTRDEFSFTLALAPDMLPFSCAVYTDGESTDVLGTPVTAWSLPSAQPEGADPLWCCGSQFMAGEVGVRFVNTGAPLQVGDGGGADMALGGSCAFNALFVRQALTGGLYLDHLLANDNIPAWREEDFATLDQARQEAEFAPYLPTAAPEDYAAYTGNKDFCGHLSYQEGAQNTLWVRWSRGYDDVEVRVYRARNLSCAMADPDNPASYDLRLYDIPWSESVPQAYRESVNNPTFRAEDMSLALVEARGRVKDTGAIRYSFQVLHPDGTVVAYCCDGLTAQQVWAMVEETLPQ